MLFCITNALPFFANSATLYNMNFTKNHHEYRVEHSLRVPPSFKIRLAPLLASLLFDNCQRETSTFSFETVKVLDKWALTRSRRRKKQQLQQAYYYTNLVGKSINLFVVLRFLKWLLFPILQSQTLIHLRFQRDNTIACFKGENRSSSNSFMCV